MNKKNDQRPKAKPLAFFHPKRMTTLLSDDKKLDKKSSDETVKLTVEKLSFGGDGIARSEGLVYFVPFTAPGDVIEANVVEKKKNFARAEINKILSAGPTRIKAPCLVYEKCGGCNWQHITYAEQLVQKQNIIKEQLGFAVENSADILPIIASSNEFNYRNRIQVRFDGKNVGYFGRKTHQLVPVTECLIAEKVINKKLAEFSSELISKKAPTEQKFELMVDQNQEVHTRDTKEESETEGFSQVNTLQNEKLVAAVLAGLANTSNEQIYDLYSGAGNFTFPIADKFPKCRINAIELSAASVKRGKLKAEAGKQYAQRVKFYLSDVESYLRRNTLDEKAVVILDPPRAGCSPEVLQALKAAKVQKIMYISCNPSSLARDLKILLDQSVFKVKKIQPFDMFPQTDHIETLIELSH